MKYSLIIEKGNSGYGAFVPDLPGCIAAGETKEETIELIKGAIEFHIEGLLDEHQPIPAAHCNIEMVDVAIAA